MSWTIATPSSGKRARKEFRDSLDVTNYRDTHIFLEDTQPLSDESLTLQLLRDVIWEINSPPHPNAFLLPGLPVNPHEGDYPLDGAYWTDCASNQHQLDLDFTSDLIAQDSSLHERSEVALEALPFLRGVARLETFSSGAGLPMVGKKNYPKRLNMRVWVQTDRPYTLAELAHYYQPWIEAELVDGGLFQANRRCYVQHPHLENTENLLENAEWCRLVEGEPLNVSKLNAAYKKPTSSYNKPASLDKNPKFDSKEVKAMKNLIRNTSRDKLPSLLNELAEAGKLENNRNALFPWLFDREAFFNSGDCALLIAQILEDPKVCGDRKGWLNSGAKWASKRILDQLRQDAQIWAARNPERVYRFDEIDLAKRDWTELRSLRAAAIKSGCGTNKTKGVIYDLVRWAKETDQSFLIVTPFVAVTEEIAEAVDIRHYHSLGDKRHQREQALTSSIRIATCSPSLQLFEKLGETPEFDIVVIDEASIVFRGMGEPETSWRYIHWLFKLCDKSKHVYAFDADLDEHTLWCLQQIENYQPEQFSLYLNSAEYGRDYNVSLFENYESLLGDLIATLNAGKRVAIALDVKDADGAITGFGKFLEKHCPNTVFKGFDSKTVTPELKTDADRVISEWLKDGMNCLAVSPWAAVGWDYLHNDEIFDEVFVLSTVGFLEATRIWQWIRRFRLTRTAKIYLNPKTALPFSDDVEKTIFREKGQTVSNREDAWKVATKQRLKLDQANPTWWFRELLKDKGANLNIIAEPDSEETPLTDELKETRKAVKKAIAREISESEEARRILSNFQIWSPFGFIKAQNATDAEILALKKRTERIDERQAKRTCEILYWDEDERREADDKEILEYNVILGRFFDAAWLVIGELVDIDRFPTIAHWYTDPESEPIYGMFDEIDFKPIQEVLETHYCSLKDSMPSLGRDCLSEPQRVLRPLATDLDLSFTTKKDHEIPNEMNVTAMEARNALWKHYEDTKETRFNPRLKVTPKLAWCVEHCLGKQRRNEPLCFEEQQFLLSRPTSFVIQRKKFVSSLWLYEMKRARDAIEDKAGFSQNHTEYCGCDWCLRQRRCLAV